MTERWRCFVAVPLPDGLRASLGNAIAAWREDPRTDGLHWVAPDAMHLTVAFLGPIDPASVPEVIARVERVAFEHAPMTRTTARLGAFARPGSARVLWYAVEDPDAALRAIAAGLDRALQLGATEPYRPHVTIARARRRWVDLRGWIDTASAEAPEGTLDINELRLMRSHLGAGPARYETLATARLGAPARA